MQHLPEPRTEPMYPAFAGRFLFTLPPDAFNLDTSLSPFTSLYLSVFKIAIIVPYNKDAVRIQTNKQRNKKTLDTVSSTGGKLNKCELLGIVDNLPKVTDLRSQPKTSARKPAPRVHPYHYWTCFSESLRS